MLETPVDRRYGKKNSTLIPHPLGESQLIEKPSLLPEKISLDSLAGKVHVEWDNSAPVTSMGQLVFFAQFLRTSDLFDQWVRNCPIQLQSNNAPAIRDLLGSIFLSVLSGHNRYAHISSISSDEVNPPLLGMSKVCSEDSVRRNCKKAVKEDEDHLKVKEWMNQELLRSYQPILEHPWILDIDGHVKTIYGRQEGAKKGYNPRKPGRPSHIYHTYFIGAVRIALDVEVGPGNQSAAKYTLKGLWRLLDRLPKNQWPEFVRGDCLFGNENVLSQAEERQVDYLFRLRLTKKPLELIRLMENQGKWKNAGQGWQGHQAQLELQGWSKKRKVIVLRRKYKERKIKVISENVSESQTELILCDESRTYEYTVLVTSLSMEILTIAQLYRDRSDMENNLDELKNQWGWAGYTTQDLRRCELLACMIALIYNWWSLFAKLVDPSRKREAITSRPLLLHGVARKITHQGQIILKVTSTHQKSIQVRELITKAINYLCQLESTAEQLKPSGLWRMILFKIFGLTEPKVLPGAT